jgi:hypothetical protein
MMSKKHYEIVAERIAARVLLISSHLNPSTDSYIVSLAALKNLARDLADDFAAEDRQFDRVRFLSLCALTPSEINLNREV